MGNKDEEDVFDVLVYILNDLKWRELFVDQTPGLFVMLEEIKGRMEEEVPEVLEHLRMLGIVRG